MMRAWKAVIICGLVPGPSLLSGQAYFQQRVDHEIRVTLDDERHMLHAHQRFTYTNNSPDALDTLWIHLWPNAYSGRNTALNRQLVSQGDVALHFASHDDTGWIDSLDLRIEQTPVQWGPHPVHPDIAWIKPPQPIAPGSWITINTPFRVKIPHSGFSRLGHTAQAYHITQWFPKPAVYDQDGWHTMPYLTQGEFYSDFGRYDVSITLPENYVVGATGILQDAAEIAWLDSLSEAPIEEPIVKSEKQINAEHPPSAERTKTLRYVQDNVHDFAWFADKRFLVRKGSVTLPRSGRTITTWTMATPRNIKLWRDAIEYVNESVRLYSEWVGDYPYDACTAVDGTISAGGGMEYPMITIIGNMADEEALDNVIAHEVGHNWFYGILATNERTSPWMDEGVNSFLELRYMRERHGGASSLLRVPILGDVGKDVRDGKRFENELFYRFNARRNLDQPLSCHSACFTSANYGGMVYAKAALAFDHLFAYLGEDVFDRCMHAYFEEWKFRHPRPKDLRAVFERESGKDLAWFFEELITSDRKVDLKALRFKGDKVQFKSTSGHSIPFPLTAWKDTTLLGTTWSDGAAGKGEVALPWQDATLVCLDHEQRTTDIDRRNNQIGSRGLLKRASLPYFGLLTGLEQHGRRSLYWVPLVARNGHDGWHLGVGLHNYHFPSQRTEWIVAPMYAFSSNTILGGGRIEHHFDRLRSSIFQNVGLSLNVRSASTWNTDPLHRRYSKIQPGVELLMKRDPLSRPWEHRIGMRAVYLRHDSRFQGLDNEQQFTYHHDDLYGELSYRIRNRHVLAPTFVNPVIQGRDGFVRGSLEITQGFTYNRRKDQLRLRVFGGTFFQKDTHLDQLEVWKLSWGPEDMLFDHVYLERGAQDGFRGRQFYKQQGAFRTPFIARSDSWIGAANVEFDLPIPLPISLFGSFGVVPSLLTIASTEGPTRTEKITAEYFEAGVGIQLVKDVIEIWFPLFVSEDIAAQEKTFGRDMADRIRFVVAFERFDPTRMLRNARP